MVREKAKKDKNIEDYNHEIFKKGINHKNIVIGNKEIPIRYSHHSDYEGDIHFLDLFRALYSDKTKMSDTIVNFQRFVDKLDDFKNISFANEIMDIVQNIQERHGDYYLDEKKLLTILPLIKTFDSTITQIAINRAFYELRKNKIAAEKSGLYGKSINNNRFDDVDTMKNLGAENRLIAIRNSIKDDKLELESYFYNNPKEDGYKCGQVQIAINKATNGKTKNSRNELSEEELIRMKEIYRQTLGFIEDRGLQSEAEDYTNVIRWIQQF